MLFDKINFYSILINHQYFSHCMDSLERKFWGKIKITIECVDRVVNRALLRVTTQENIDVPTNDVTKMKGFRARIINSKNITCKCAEDDKLACTTTGHKMQYHILEDYNFYWYNEDLDYLH